MSWLPAAIGVGGGLLQGLFGGSQEPELPPELQQLYQFLFKQAKQARRYGMSGAMTDPRERNALASQEGLIGQKGYVQQREMEGQLQPFMSGNIPSFLSNLKSNQSAQQGGAVSNAYQNSLNNRFAAQFQWAPQIASMAGGPAGGQRYTPPGQTGDLSGMLGQFARDMAFNNAMKSYDGASGSGAPGGMPPPHDFQAPYSGTQQNNWDGGVNPGGFEYDYYRNLPRTG